MNKLYKCLGQTDKIIELIKTTAFAKRTYQSESAINLLVQHQEHEALDFLLNFDKSLINRRNRYGCTGVNIAVRNSDLKSLNMLPSHGATLDMPDPKYFMNLMYDFSPTNAKILEVIIERQSESVAQHIKDYVKLAEFRKSDEIIHYITAYQEKLQLQKISTAKSTALHKL